MPPSARALIVTVVIAAGTAACTDPGATGPAGGGDDAVVANAVVVQIADGDTIDVTVDGRRERVRLIGIDTPETKKPDTPIQCYGPEATAYTTALVPVGTAVRLERDVEPRDPFSRLLAYVYRADDGLFVNRALADGGFAAALSIAPNTAHADELADAVAAARRAGLGLWGACPAFGSPASPAGAGPPGGG